MFASEIKKRDKRAALKLLRKAMRQHGRPEVFVTDKLCLDGAALREVGASGRQETGRWMEKQGADFSLAFSKGRTRNAWIAAHAKSAEMRFRSRLRPPPFHRYSRGTFKANSAAALTEWRGLCAAS